jgi:hypothetical protein
MKTKSQRPAGNTSEPAPAVTLTSADWAIAVTAALLIVGLGVYRLTPNVCGVYHDDAIYVSTAKALADGLGYRLINLPGSPLQTKYPIFYPMILAVVWRVWRAFPANLLAMQLVSLFSGAVSMGASYLFMVRFRYASRVVAAASVGICATAAFVVYLSTQTLSEMPFSVLVILALWRLEMSLRRQSSGVRADMATGVLQALPFLCRSIGFIVILTAILTLLRRRRPVVWTTIGAAIVVTPWLVWTLYGVAHWSSDPLGGYYTDYVGAWSSLAIPNLPKVIATNGLLGVVSPLTVAFSGLTESGLLVGHSLPPWVVIAFLAAGVTLWARVAIRAFASQSPALLLAGQAALLLAWPWPPNRFVAPMLPLLLASIGPSAGGVAAFRISRPWRLAAVGLVAAVIGLNAIGSVRLSTIVRQTGYPYITTPAVEASWNSYTAELRFIQERTGTSDKIASGLDTMVYIYTGRQSFRPFTHRPDALFYGATRPPTGSVDDFFEILRRGGAKYLAVFPMPGFAEDEPFNRLVSKALAANPERLAAVYVGTDPRFEVFAIRTD